MDLISNTNRKDSSQKDEYNELHQKHSLENHSLEIVINNGIDLNRLLKNRKKPNKQQRKAKQQKLEKTQEIENFIGSFCEKTGFKCPGFEHQFVSTLLLLLRDWI